MNTRGRLARVGLKNSAQTASSKMSNLKATEMKRPSQAMPQLCSFSGQRRWGSTRKARGVRNTNRPRITANVRVKYRRQSSPTLSSRSLVIRTISSWERLCSDVPVMAVVVSPQLSSCKYEEKEKEMSTSAAYVQHIFLLVFKN